MRRWIGIAGIAAAVMIAGCGHGNASSDAACRNEATVMADRADAMLRHYAGMVYPADMSYLLFKASLDWYDAHRCAPDLLGQALENRLTPKRRQRFIDLLPSTIARTVREALASSRRNGGYLRFCYGWGVTRRDAVRNRELLIAAGRDAFAEQGERASLEEIARRAGVGIGTLYRHFSTREALVEVIFEEHIDAVVAAAERGAASADAWEGLVGFLEQVLELQARNLPLRDVFVRHPAGEGRIAEQRRRIGVLLRRLVASARRQGSVRDDFTVGDLVFAMWSFMPLVEASAAVAPNAWRRHLRILLDGFRPAGATPQRVRPLTARQMEAAIAALRGGYRRRRAA